jgi:hypothetical protein
MFDGERFVAPTVLSNGSIQLTFIATNSTIATTPLFVNGNTARLAINGSDYLLAWVETNTTPSLLKCARVANGVVSRHFVLAIDVAEETLVLSGNAGHFIAVWQSTGSKSAIIGRALRGDGSPAAEAFTVSSSAQPQRYPAIDTDGTSHLVCWVEQNSGSNDWRVLARVISNSVPVGTTVTVSQTNSLTPHPTACSFGTNYLVAWSADEGPYVWCLDFLSGSPDSPCARGTNYWFSLVYGRMLSRDGKASGETFSINPSTGTNIKPAAAFGGGRYLVGCENTFAYTPGFEPSSHYHSRESLQPLAPDGSRSQYPVPTFLYYEVLPYETLSPRIAFGGDRFCVLYSGTNHQFAIFYGAARDEPIITNLRQGTNGLVVEMKGPVGFEISTNLVDWHMAEFSNPRPITNGVVSVDVVGFFDTDFSLGGVTKLSELLTRSDARLFIRVASQKWPCIENLRAIQWAKQQWALDNRLSNLAVPAPATLFGPGLYFPKAPFCPSGGTYSIHGIQGKPICNIAGHTL